MYAKIVKDHLGVEDVLGPDFAREGMVVIGQGSNEPDGLIDVRLLDDDRELYYEVRASEDSLEHLMDWGMHDAGATILQTKDMTGEWRDTIG